MFPVRLAFLSLGTRQDQDVHAVAPVLPSPASPQFLPSPSTLPADQVPLDHPAELRAPRARLLRHLISEFVRDRAWSSVWKIAIG